MVNVSVPADLQSGGNLYKDLQPESPKQDKIHFPNLPGEAKEVGGTTAFFDILEKRNNGKSKRFNSLKIVPLQKSIKQWNITNLSLRTSRK